MASEMGSSRNILVTGAVRRIGRAVSQRLARAGYGLALHASARSAEEAQDFAASLRADGRRAGVVIADLASATEVGGLIAAAEEAVGPLEALVNNASVYEPDSAAPFDADLFDRHMAVNLRAPLQLSADFAARRRGSIVNVTDQKVWRLNPRFFTYTLSKAALWTATQTMAQAFAPHVRVNAVGPGPVLPNHVEGADGFQREAAAVPLGASVPPEDVAEAVLFLIEAKSITGQMIAVDGGQHIGWKTPDVAD